MPASSRLNYLARRLFHAILVMIGVVAASFFMVRLAPGDAAMAIAGQLGFSDPKLVEQIRVEFGLDQPLLVQFWIYLSKFVQGDLGLSYQMRQPVLTLVLERLPATLLLTGVVIVFSLVVGVFFGILAARRPGGFIDGLVRIAATAFYALPSYWLGLMLVLLFSLHLGWLPPFGLGGQMQGASALDRALDVAAHLVLPGLTLGLFSTAIYARLTRASMLEVAHLDYIKTARAKGISEQQVTLRHILRNALIPIVTYAGLQTSSLVGGAVLVETVFSWPGIGRLAYDALTARDNNLLLGVFVVTSALVITFNLITDLLYVLLDPRVEAH